MKKLIYGGLFLGFIGITFIGCKKEIVSNSNTQTLNMTKSTSLTNKSIDGYRSDEQMLIFNDANSYEMILTNLMEESKDDNESIETKLIKEFNSLNYTSYTEYLSIKGQNENDPIEDDLLSAMLNKDLVFQIGNYLYRVNKEREKVFVLPSNKIVEYQDLVSESKTNPNIRQFSTDDDVIELAESGATGEEKGIFCKDRKANKKNSSSNVVTVLASPKIEMYIEAMYNKYGVYNTLKAVGTHQQNISELRYYFQIENSSWAQRCGSSKSNYSHPWRTKTSGTMSSGIYKEKFKFYQGMKQLKNYRFKVRFRCENWYQPSAPNPYTVYFTKYILIEDY